MRLLLLAALLAARPLRAQDPPALDPAVTHVTTGGTWQDGSRHGHYRLIVVGSGWAPVTSRLLIQWMEEDPALHRFLVRDSRTVTVIADSWSLGPPQFVAGTRSVKATVAGTDPHTGHAATWSLTLGPPGQFSVSPLR